MSRFLKSLIAALAFGAAAILASVPAHAGQAMCQSDVSGASTGARAIGGTASGVPSGTLYVLNGQGCAWVPQQDIGWFLSQGFTAGNNSFSVSVKGLTAQSTTSNSPILPPYAYITGIVIQETAAQAVTGGLDIGIAGASDATIASAVTCAASCLVAVADSALLRKVFGAAGAASGTPSAQQVFFNAHTNWTDGATVNATILYSLFGPP